MISKYLQYAGAFCLFLAVGFVSPQSALAKVELVAKVGSVPVTNFELARSYQKIMPFQVNFHGNVSAERKAEIRKEALDKLVERAYKVQFAISEEISVSNDAVEAKMSGLKKKFASEEAFQEAVKVEGFSEFRASVYRKLLAEKAEDVHVLSKINITDDELKAYYEENKSRFKRPRGFKASHILIRVDPASNDEERQELLAKAEGILERAKAEEDFYNLAYYNSDDRTKYVGGDLGFFHEGQTVEPFEQALLKLKPGEVSDLVKTRFGYHIIKLNEVQESRQLTYDEMAGKLRAQLEKEEFDNLYSHWLEELKARYKVEIY